MPLPKDRTAYVFSLSAAAIGSRDAVGHMLEAAREALRIVLARGAGLRITIECDRSAS